MHEEHLHQFLIVGLPIILKAVHCKRNNAASQSVDAHSTTNLSYLSLSDLYTWILRFLLNLLLKFAHALSDWTETISEQRFSCLATYSQVA